MEKNEIDFLNQVIETPEKYFKSEYLDEMTAIGEKYGLLENAPANEDYDLLQKAATAISDYALMKLKESLAHMEYKLSL